MSVCIIAEAGVNHNGSLERAKEMILAAKRAKVDYVKFQTFIPKNLVTVNAEMAGYQKKNTKQEKTQLEMLEELALTQSDFCELNSFCKECKIGFLSTPFDLESIEFLTKLHMDFWKVPSGEITNYPYLLKIAQTKKKVVLSTGMSNLLEIEQAIKVLRENGTPEIQLLHCNTQYPTQYKDVNLSAMQTLKNTFGLPVGYSDHTLGIEVDIAAVAMGAIVIEKHFTLDHSLPGPDHKASLNPEQLNQMVESIRNIEVAIGLGTKEPTNSEKENIQIARKSIVAKVNIKKGEVLTTENLTVKRPGRGISPMEWNAVIGTIAVKDFREDELISI